MTIGNQTQKWSNEPSCMFLHKRLKVNSPAFMANIVMKRIEPNSNFWKY